MHKFEKFGEYGYGLKMLDPTGCTYRGELPFIYTLPGQGEKWARETVHPDPVLPDGNECGQGRLHVHKICTAGYAPANWWPWFARYPLDMVIGESSEKAGVAKLQLRRIAPRVWHRTIRLGWWSEADLSEADLRGADLRGADLSGANLSGANLYGANLYGAHYCNHTVWPVNFSVPDNLSKMED